MVGLDARELGGHLVEDLAEEGEGSKDVRLVDAGDARSRAVPTLGEPEGRPDHPLGPAPGDHLGIGGELVAEHDPPAERGEEPLGALADHDEVDRRIARQGARDAVEPACGADPRVQVEHDPQRHLGDDLGAVGIADPRQSARPEQDRIGRAARRQGRLRERLPPVEIRPRPGRSLDEVELEARHRPAGLGEHVEGAADHLGADPVAADDRDPIRPHRASRSNPTDPLPRVPG